MAFQAVVYKSKFDGPAKTALRFNQGLAEFLDNEIVKQDWEAVAGSKGLATRDEGETELQSEEVFICRYLVGFRLYDKCCFGHLTFLCCPSNFILFSSITNSNAVGCCYCL